VGGPTGFARTLAEYTHFDAREPPHARFWPSAPVC